MLLLHAKLWGLCTNPASTRGRSLGGAETGRSVGGAADASWQAQQWGLESLCGSTGGVSIKCCDIQQHAGVQGGSRRPARGLGLEKWWSKQDTKRSILQLLQVSNEARNARSRLVEQLVKTHPLWPHGSHCPPSVHRRAPPPLPSPSSLWPGGSVPQQIWCHVASHSFLTVPVAPTCLGDTLNLP